MSSYGTEYEHADEDGDNLYINRCQNGNYPLMFWFAGGRHGVEMYRDDVERLQQYLAGIADTVPERPEPAPEPTMTVESAGVIRNGQHIWFATRLVCQNTMNIGGKRI